VHSSSLSNAAQVCVGDVHIVQSRPLRNPPHTMTQHVLILLSYAVTHCAATPPHPFIQPYKCATDQRLMVNRATGESIVINRFPALHLGAGAFPVARPARCKAVMAPEKVGAGLLLWCVNSLQRSPSPYAMRLVVSTIRITSAFAVMRSTLRWYENLVVISAVKAKSLSCYETHLTTTTHGACLEVTLTLRMAQTCSQLRSARLWKKCRCITSCASVMMSKTSE
jgi:hypothetical protein